MKFPANSLLAGNLRTSETGSLETASSSGESAANRAAELTSCYRSSAFFAYGVLGRIAATPKR